MQGSDDGSTRHFGNVFLKDFLRRLAERNEPRTSAEADVAGPWGVEAHCLTWYGVYRRGESATRGHLPAGAFADLSHALLAAAALPAPAGTRSSTSGRTGPRTATPWNPEAKSSPTSPTSTRSWSTPSTSWRAS